MSALSDKDANSIIRQAWKDVHGREPTDKEALFSQAIARLETGYGRIGQHGTLAEQGYYNWGNLEKKPLGSRVPEEYQEGYDNGKKVWFRVFPSDLEAAKAMIATLTKRHWPVVEAMKGAAKDVAKAMKVAPAYYEASEDSYANALEGAANHIRTKLNKEEPTLPAMVVSKGIANAKETHWIPKALLGVGMLSAGFYWYKKGR